MNDMNDMNETINDMDPVDYKDFADRATSLSMHYAVNMVDAAVNAKELTAMAEKFDEDTVGLFNVTGHLFYAKLRSQNLPDAFIDDMQNLLIAMNSYSGASAICRTLIQIEQLKNGNQDESIRDNK